MYITSANTNLTSKTQMKSLPNNQRPLAYKSDQENNMSFRSKSKLPSILRKFDPTTLLLGILAISASAISNLNKIDDYKDKVNNSNIEHIETPKPKFNSKTKQAYKKESQIKNSYYKGDSYNIIQKNDIITIENRLTGKIQTLNLEELCKDLRPIVKNNVKDMMLKLPAEVLVDYAVEIQQFKHNRNFNESFYAPQNNNIYLGVNQINYFGSTVLVHELGHAIDLNGMFYNTAESASSLKNVFNPELNLYLKAGHYPGEAGAYATTNVNEMFAECYTLLMLGNCVSKTVIEKYFPKSLANVKQLVGEIRNKPNFIRRSILQ